MLLWKLAGVVGGLVLTAIFLPPAVAALRRKKIPRGLVILMVLAGSGVALISLVLAGFLTDITGQVVLGSVALGLFLGGALGIGFDWKDGNLSRPGHLVAFFLPSLLAVVVVTADATLTFAGRQADKVWTTISTQAQR